MTPWTAARQASLSFTLYQGAFESEGAAGKGFPWCSGLIVWLTDDLTRNILTPITTDMGTLYFEPLDEFQKTSRGKESLMCY